jgi:broad specificity phosphatase PhoE
MSSRLLLVRHARTDDAPLGILRGWSQVPLGAAGHWQAGEIAHYIWDEYRKAAITSVLRPVPCKLYSSPLPRARETAEHIEQALQEERGVSVTLLDGLREINFGVCEGWAWSQLACDFPHIYEADIAERDVQWPGGESRHEFSRRLSAAFDAILAATRTPEMDGGIVVVVTHSGPIARFLAKTFEDDEAKWRQYKVPKASVTELLFTKSGAIADHRVVFAAEDKEYTWQRHLQR